MKLSVYVPKNLEQPFLRQAKTQGLSPSRFVQDLIRKSVKERPNTFSDEFLALAGSWEDDRTADEICREIRESRVDAERPKLL